MKINNMNENKNLVVKKEGFFTKIINKIKELFGKKQMKENVQEINQKEESIKEYESENMKKDFGKNIKVEANSEILSLKIKFENEEIKAIDLTDEQIDELQKIYDKEIEEKKKKIEKFQGVA